MYMMCLIDFEMFEGIKDELDFCQRLLTEECLFTLPSTCFYTKGMFRVMICHPEDKLIEMGK